jgi:hypothetical protein
VDVRAEDARFRHEHLRSGEGVLAQRREERRHHAVRAVGERRRAAVEAAERVDQEESAAAPGVPRHFDAVPQVLHRGPQDVLVPEVVEVHVGREDCGELRHRLRQVQTVSGFEQRQAHPAVLLQFGRLLQRDDHPSEQTLRGVDQDQDAGVERRSREALRQRQIGRVHVFELREGRHQRLRVRHSQRAGPAQQELSHFGDGRQQERRLVDKADVEGRRLVLGRARPEQYQSGGDDQQFAVEARRRRRTIPEGVERDQKRQQRLQGTARVALQLPHDHSPRKHEEDTERGGHGAADDRRPRQLDRRAGNDHSGDDNATGEDFVVSVHANGHECELLRVKKNCDYIVLLQPSYELILERVATIRAKFQTLVQTQTDALSAGKMLLMGFNGLFEKLSQEMHSLVNTLGSLDIPSSWKKLDQVKEAKSIAAHIFNPKVHEILEDIFLLKRLQAMSEFFGLTLEMCQSFKKGSGKHVVFNDEQLVKPVRQFIADFISRQLLGITTEAVAYTVCFLLQNLSLDVAHEIEQKDIGAETKVPLDELCHKAWNYLLKQGVFTQNLVSQASGFSANLKSAWEKIQEPKKIELKLTVLQSSAMRIQNQLTVYNFMYEEILTQLHVYTGVRSKFIMDLKSEMTTLKTVHAKLIEAREKQQCLVDNAYQRLNWAKGANPNVIEISAAFESAVTSRDGRLNQEQTIGDKVLTACKVILQHELLRTHCNESKAYDKLFLNSFEKWRIACQYTSSRNDVLTPTEESIMNLLTSDLLHNPKWLEAISEIISDLITMSQKKLGEEKAGLMCLAEEASASLEKFKEVYNVHCKLMGDVKSLIKSMTKIEDYGVQTQQFITDYRQYIDNFSSLFSKFKKEMTIDDVVSCIDHLHFLEQHTEPIYGDLLNLEAKRNRPQLTRQDCISASPLKMSKQESTAKGQQRNAYAVNVWRRVKMKLEGRDPDPGRKYTSQEQVGGVGWVDVAFAQEYVVFQVDYVIREATNLDNLALLYEGWTPWV